MNFFFFNNEFLTELIDMKINLDIFFFQTAGTVENPNPLTIQASESLDHLRGNLQQPDVDIKKFVSHMIARKFRVLLFFG